jgi:hypothetical protein
MLTVEYVRGRWEQNSMECYEEDDLDYQPKKWIWSYKHHQTPKQMKFPCLCYTLSSVHTAKRINEIPKSKRVLKIVSISEANILFDVVYLNNELRAISQSEGKHITERIFEKQFGKMIDFCLNFIHPRKFPGGNVIIQIRSDKKMNSFVLCQTIKPTEEYVQNHTLLFWEELTPNNLIIRLRQK